MNAAAGRAPVAPFATFPWWLPAAAALAYLNALEAAFQFDDYRVIVDNPKAHGLAAWWAAMPGIRPLLKLSYALNWSASPAAFGFHAVNLLLHLANVALVWRLTAHFPPPAGGEHRRGARARLFATLLFALHPIQTEAVTYVSGRSMSLMALFGLAALLAWLEAGRRPRPPVWRGLSLVLFAAAVATKEVALVLPLALLLLRFPRPAARPIWPALALVGLLAGLLGLLWLLGYGYLLATPPPRGLAANLASETHALFYLLGQLFRPHALNIDPDLPEYAHWAPLPSLEAAALIALLAYAWSARRRLPWLFFGLAWWLLLLLPTHSLVPRADLASERHLYLAALGLYWIAAVALAGLPALRPAPRWIGLVAGLAILGALFTALRNADYRDEISLWRATAARSPGKARVWNNLGYAHALAGQAEPARAAFLEALRLDPRHERAARNLRALDGGAFSRPPPPAYPPALAPIHRSPP
jgi:tetratricopeptide (TPR) repeat protein